MFPNKRTSFEMNKLARPIQCSLKQAATLGTCYLLCSYQSGRQDSNLRPRDPKSRILNQLKYFPIVRSVWELNPSDLLSDSQADTPRIPTDHKNITREI